MPYKLQTTIAALRVVTPRRSLLIPLYALVLAGSAGTASAQVVESVGSRALGMGGAFVAVASDSSATWWNPAGLAAGSFVDVAVGGGSLERAEDLPARRDNAFWATASVPALGFSYYRLHITDIQRSDSTGQPSGSREDTQVGPPVRSFAENAFGVTLVHSLFTGVHVATTLKYVRGTVRQDTGAHDQSPDEWLDEGESLDGGSAENKFDMDAGVLAVVGVLRMGAVVKNLLAPSFGGTAFTLPRQGRVGVAIDPARGGRPVWIGAVDADVLAYETTTGRRQMLAAGVERWFGTQRVGVRAGGRANMTGEHEYTVTGGVSALIRSGLSVVAHVAAGGADAEQGWGLEARVTF